MSVPGENVSTNIGYLVTTVRVVLSVLVSWEIRVTGMLCVSRSERISSSGTLDWTPFSTNRGCIASGKG
jgi:hypothetical protein